MMTLIALIVTTSLMPQPASAVSMPVAATWSSMEVVAKVRKKSEAILARRPRSDIS
jgi:hypothetical protein